MPSQPLISAFSVAINDFDVGDYMMALESVTNISNLSPTQTIFNIRLQYHCKRCYE